MKKIFLWISIGVLCALAAFFIAYQPGSMWLSVLSASTIAFVYLVIFSAVWLKKIKSSTKRKAIATTFMVLFVFSVASAVISYEQSVRQRKNLEKIRGQLEGDILYNYMHEPLIKTLGEYYTEDDSESSIGEIFSTRYDSLITDEGAFEFGSNDDNQTLYLYIAQNSADSVVIIGESRYLNGKSEDFSNYSGDTGHYQVRGMLTSEGIDYERQN